jgi:hypothetical protein
MIACQYYWCRLALFCAVLIISLQVNAQNPGTDWSVAVLDKILATVQPGQQLIQVGDMEMRSDLITGGWSVLADEILGTGGAIQVVDPGVGALPRDFYRLDVLP